MTTEAGGMLKRELERGSHTQGAGRPQRVLDSLFRDDGRLSDAGGRRYRRLTADGVTSAIHADSEPLVRVGTPPPNIGNNLRNFFS